MKRYSIAAAAIALLSVMSCNKDKPQEEEEVIPRGFEILEGATVDQYYSKLFESEYEETDKAFPNALKGFRDAENEYATLAKKYIPWSDIENKESDGVEKILSYSNREFQPLFNEGIRVIPRVYLCWPHDEQNAEGTRVEVEYNGKVQYIDEHWPEDMTVNDYESDQFKERVVKLIEKMAKAWDEDKRVAFVEMGLIGYWGEQHSPTPTLEIQKILADAFIKYFKHKKVMIRYPDQFKDYDNFGFYNDSFGHANEMGRVPLFIERDIWRNSVYGGEVAYNYGNWQLQPGANPDETLTEPEHLNYQLECIRLLHANHVGWIGQYTADNPQVAEGAAKVQKALGYRFVIQNAKFTQCLDASHNELSLEMNIVNVGSSLLYEYAPIRVVLMNPTNRKVVWSAEFTTTDGSKWLPGDKWDNTKGVYTVAPEVYNVAETFKVEGQIPEGGYLLAVTMLDQFSMEPAYKFAHDNYYRGGYTVLGKVGYGRVLMDPSIKGISFYDIKKEKLVY